MTSSPACGCGFRGSRDLALDVDLDALIAVPELVVVDRHGSGVDADDAVVGTVTRGRAVADAEETRTRAPLAAMFTRADGKYGRLSLPLGTPAVERARGRDGTVRRRADGDVGVARRRQRDSNCRCKAPRSHEVPCRRR